MANESRLEELIERVRKAEEDVSAEIERLVDEQKERFHYKVESGKIRFEEAVALLQNAIGAPCGSICGALSQAIYFRLR